MNHHKYNKYFTGSLGLLLVFAIVSCQQVIDLNLDNARPRLVVEGRIERSTSQSEILEQQIKLTMVNDFFQNTAPPVAGGAEVWVTDFAGNRFTFDEVEAGMYINVDLQHTDNEVYTLNIIWEGQNYQATEQLISVPPIDSIYQIETESNLFEDGGIKLAIDFTDPGGDANYYFWETYVDGELKVFPDPGNKNNLIAKDDFFDGQSVQGYLPNEELVIEVGSEVNVRQIGLSENAYRYYFALFDQAGKTGSILDTPPALVRGNIVNLDDSENFALGYFYVAEVSDAARMITESN